MRDRKTLGIVVVVIAAWAIFAFGDLTIGTPIPAVDCPFDTGDVGTNVTCFQVPSEGGSMMVTVLHRGGTALEHAPVLMLPTQPGETPSFDLDRYADMALLNHRDLVLVDPIGAGRSTPLIGCDGLGYGVDLDALRRCREDLTDADVRLEDFGSERFVADLVRVHEALGQGRSWSRWHLVGRSYGSQLALRLAEVDVAGVESVVIGSAIPPDVPSFATRALAWEPAIAALTAACAADGGCRHFAPPAEAADRIARRLDARPEPLEIPLPDGEAELISFDDAALRTGVSRALDVPGMPSLLPWLLDRVDGAASEFGLDRTTRSALTGLRSITAVGPTIDPALWWTIVCSEQLPLIDEATLTEGYRATPELIADLDPAAACAVWSTGSTGAPPTASAEVTVPTLVLSARVDPLGTQTWTDRAVAQGPEIVVVETWSSEVVPGTLTCSANTAADFFDDPRTLPAEECAGEPVDFARFPVPVGSVRQLGATGETGPLIMAVLGLGLALAFAVWSWLATPGGRARSAWLAVALLAGVSFVGSSLVLVMNPSPTSVIAQPFSAWLVFGLPWLVAGATVASAAATIRDVQRHVIGGHWPARYALLGTGIVLSLLGATLLGMVPGL